MTTERKNVRVSDAANRRVTLRDIAAKVGVSEAAASFALNGKPGVSDETRRKVLAVADELEWSPNHAARVLSGARSGTIGLVIARSIQDVGTESFFLRLMTGIQDVLSRRQFGLMLQVVGSVQEEIATYRRWNVEGRVDGVVLVDLRTDDPRPEVLASMGLPAIIAGGPDPRHILPAVSIDDSAAMSVIMQHLHDYGHERVVYICGNETMLHVSRRIDAFRESISRLGSIDGHSVSTDFSPGAGAAATAAIMQSGQRPSALVYDNEILALAGIGALGRLGLRIPDDVSVVVWEDTAVCRAVEPPLTALQRDTFGFGADVAERLLEILDGGSVTDYEERLPALDIRASSARVQSRS